MKRLLMHCETGPGKEPMNLTAMVRTDAATASNRNRWLHYSDPCVRPILFGRLSGDECSTGCRTASRRTRTSKRRWTHFKLKLFDASLKPSAVCERKVSGTREIDDARCRSVGPTVFCRQIQGGKWISWKRNWRTCSPARNSRKQSGKRGLYW
jgi:hypothetical protein